MLITTMKAENAKLGKYSISFCNVHTFSEQCSSFAKHHGHYFSYMHSTYTPEFVGRKIPQ